MKDKQGLSRRDFIRNSVMAGGAMLLSGVLPSKAGIPVLTDTEDSDLSEADELLRGVSDIHLHAAPDSKARLGNELEFARAARNAGYKSMLFKSNDFSCHDRAYLIRQSLPDFEVFGSICMNRVHGEKVNVFAAEKAVNTTGSLCRCIWMPTQDAVYQNIRYHGKKEGVPVLDDNEHVLPEVVRVMEICAEANIIFATGHSSPEESIALARKAREVGVEKCVVTHANSGIRKMTHDQIKRCLDFGAWIEYSYITNLWGTGTGLPDFERMSDKEFAGFARIAPEHSFITTDLGQVGMPHPVEGMRRCILALLENGLSQQQVNHIVRYNPATLVGLSAI
ncbi:DUF6282 family protein [Bacteroides sp.]|uniref:DUF6282 family protein n=1 Tax=Bacteroides sp. TaxID=29523 RepID=UPI003AB54F5D